MNFKEISQLVKTHGPQTISIGTAMSEKLISDFSSEGIIAEDILINGNTPGLFLKADKLTKIMQSLPEEQRLSSEQEKSFRQMYRKTWWHVSIVCEIKDHEPDLMDVYLPDISEKVYEIVDEATLYFTSEGSSEDKELGLIEFFLKSPVCDQDEIEQALKPIKDNLKYLGARHIPTLKFSIEITPAANPLEIHRQSKI